MRELKGNAVLASPRHSSLDIPEIDRLIVVTCEHQQWSLDRSNGAEIIEVVLTQFRYPPPPGRTAGWLATSAATAYATYQQPAVVAAG